MSVIEKVLAAAAARKRKEQSRTGDQSSTHEVSTASSNKINLAQQCNNFTSRRAASLHVQFRNFNLLYSVTSRCVTSFCVTFTSRHVSPCHVTPLDFTSCHVALRHVLRHFHITSVHVSSCHATPLDFTSCHVALRHVFLRHFTSRHVTSLHISSFHPTQPLRIQLVQLKTLLTALQNTTP